MKKHLDLMGAFPFDRHPQMRAGQRIALKHLKACLENAAALFPVVHQSPVGTGKTALGYTFLKAYQNIGARQLFYSAPNKTHVEQVHTMFPDVKVMFGRNEHPCLYPGYPEGTRADDIPCSMLTNCPHRVNPDTGETHTPGAARCPYLQQKYEAKQGGIVACTHAFLVFNVLLSKQFEPEAVVIDEAHRLAQSFRSVLSTEITDYRLVQAMEAVEETSPRQCEKLAEFLASLKRTVKRYALDVETLLEEKQILRLYETLSAINADRLEADAKRAVEKGKLHPVVDRDTLKQIEEISRSIRRFQHTLKFTLSGQTARGYPLAYVIASGKTEMGPHDKVQYRLTIRDYYVVPLIQKMLPEATYAYSATIVDPEIFSYETGIRGSYFSIPSDFPSENTRLYLPTDTANLAVKARQKRDKTKTIRLIARTAKRFADKETRSLVIVVSNEERMKFLELAKEEGLTTLTYGNGIPPRECARRFLAGEGDCLVGTTANFGEGLDLPAQVAPVIFCLRPGYPHPDDPQTQFEERRLRGQRWKLWQWRVMLEMLQARGRNVRSANDIGVTFLISQQFRNFAFGSLPDHLQAAYRGNLKWEECVKDAEQLLARE
ncbi:MAG: helicase C-terminal domain-containing protein [Patescibacteria group bacterium]